MKNLADKHRVLSKARGAQAQPDTAAVKSVLATRCCDTQKEGLGSFVSSDADFYHYLNQCSVHALDLPDHGSVLGFWLENEAMWPYLLNQEEGFE